MKSLPSDLMIEQLEMAKMTLPKGVENEVQTLEHCVVHQVSIRDEEGAKALGREMGRYVTIETDKSYQIGEPAFEEIASALADQMKRMLKNRKKILVLGIGNPHITPDSLGSKAVERLMVTRPLKDRPKQYASVSAMAASVYGVSGIESAELAQGLVQSIAPEAVILIDAMATARLERLCQTIQLSDSGLTPGGGVDNTRKEISEKTLGVPVLSVGMPTVVDCRVLLWHVLGEDWEKYSVKLHPFEESLIATPRQMELATDMGARLIAFAINKALHGDISTEEILKYLY
ncbi:MAG: GPR endopeptidase [Clostridia bacterium]|nr:GPR endopeptidase [Clostridia bacterium]